jgi:tetratricopeptide (TPR) repeat protein
VVGAAGPAIFLAAGIMGGLLLLGACIWGLLGLLLMKEISGLEFLLYTGALLGLVVFGILGATGLGPIGLLPAVLLAIAFPLSRRWANQRGLARLEQEDIDKYRHTIAKRPEIPYPYRRLAEIYFKRGNYDVAADWYRKYLEVADDPEVQHRYRRVLQLMEQAKEKQQPCTECRFINTGDARYCANCGAMMPGPWEIIEAFRGKKGLRYLQTVALVSLIVGAILGFILQLNYIYMMLCFLNAAGAGVYYLYKRVTAY